MPSVASRNPLFSARDAERVRKTLRELDDGHLLSDLGDTLDRALHGSDLATREYVREYRRLTRTLLDEARTMHPDLISATSEGLTMTDLKGRPAKALVGALENGSAEAPFTPWAARFELSDAVALDLTNRVRIMLGIRALTLPEHSRADQPAVDDLTAERFLRRVRHHLNHPDHEHPLLRIMSAFGLSKTELGALFGVKRQAVDGWLAGGVPADRQEKVGTLLALCDLLERKLKTGRLPGVARRPADAYGGQTMLDLIAADRHRALLETVRDSFDWATAA